MFLVKRWVLAHLERLKVSYLALVEAVYQECLIKWVFFGDHQTLRESVSEGIQF